MVSQLAEISWKWDASGLRQETICNGAELPTSWDIELKSSLFEYGFQLAANFHHSAGLLCELFASFLDL